MNILNNKIPLSPIKSQLIAGAIIGIFVFLILAVFQPFGTYEFEMRNKILFLLGYGVISFISYSGFYLLFQNIFPKWFNPQQWTTFRELLTIVMVLLVLTYLSLLYHSLFFGNYKISLFIFIGFFKYTLAVGALPFSVLYYRKWINLKLTQTIPESNNENLETKIVFESANKKEKALSVLENEILFIQSNGNYIEVHTLVSDEFQKHLLRNTLNNIIGQLNDESFMKIHRSYIVNLKMIDQVFTEGSNYLAKIKNSTFKIPISRNQVVELRKRLK